MPIRFIPQFHLHIVKSKPRLTLCLLVLCFSAIYDGSDIERDFKLHGYFFLSSCADGCVHTCACTHMWLPYVTCFSFQTFISLKNPGRIWKERSVYIKLGEKPELRPCEASTGFEKVPGNMPSPSL